MESILVISPPRSGSSCTAGCLHLCGISLGKDVAKVKNKYNQKGYFENMKILRFNHRVLNAINTNIFLLGLPTEEQVSKSMTFIPSLRDIINEEYSKEERFLIKDPRIGILQNLYLKTLESMRITVKTVILRRKIEAVAKSINRMQGLGVEKSRHIYEVYMKILDTIKNKTTHIEINFEELLEQPFLTINRLANFLQITPPSQKLINEFIDISLVNFK